MGFPEGHGDIAVLLHQLHQRVDLVDQRKRQVKYSAPDEFEHPLRTAVDETPGEKARFGDHRFASKQWGFDHVPLLLCPTVMRIA